MAIALSQDNRLLQATTPLGADVLVPLSLEGEEAVSRPFRFVVDFISTDASVAAASLLGKPVTLAMATRGGASRHVHGIVRRFASLGTFRDFARYRAEVVPQLWFLSLSSETRTFEEKSVVDIVEQVLREGGVTEVSFRVVATMPPLPYVVQYRESHLAFVSRLLEEAGLYYTFEHADGKHTLVVTDAHAGSVPAGKVATVRLGVTAPGALPESDTVLALEREFAVHSSKVDVRDHDLLRADSVGSAQSQNPGAAGTLVDFLGDLGPNASSVAATHEIEREEAGHDQVSGRSNCAPFTAGTRVKLTGGILGTGGLEVHLLRVRHRLENGDVIAGGGADARYENEFTAIAAATRFRPAEETPRPSVRGTQVAEVVGAGGVGEIDVDANGCVLLRFPWDNGAGKDGSSKHRVHVASAWAGAGWGFIQLPRVGQEVLVEFLEGDPARPLVTGRVYNSVNKPPYALPGSKTQSGWKSRTLGGEAENFNELRFEDKKGDEHVFLQAEKNLQVKVKVDETRTVGNDRTTVVQNKDVRTVKESDDEHTIEKGNHTFTVSKGDHSLEVTEGGQQVKVKKDRKITVTDGDWYVEINKGHHLTHVDKGNWAANAHDADALLKAKKKVQIEAGDELSLKCGAGSIVIKKDGTITIKGTQLKIEGSAKVEVKGAQVKVDGQAQVEVSGAMLKIEGKAMTTIKGAIAQVTGSGMLKAGGGITMLG